MKLKDIDFDKVAAIEVHCDGRFIDIYHIFHTSPNPSNEEELKEFKEWGETPHFYLCIDNDSEFSFDVETEVTVEEGHIIRFKQEDSEYELSCYRFEPAEIV